MFTGSGARHSLGGGPACIRLEAHHMIGPRDGLSITGGGRLRGVAMTMAMGDFFPSAPRVIYKLAPLVQVICQLRFPTILRVETEAPAQFQETIRQSFPIFDRVNPFPAQLPEAVMRALGGQANVASYQFHTEDRTSTVELTPQSISLSMRKYRRWEEFSSALRAPLSAFVEVYRPSYFERAGLRYQDLIQRESIGLNGVPWSRLLRPEILGELTVEVFEQNLLDARRVLRVKTPSGSGFILLQHGLATGQGRKEAGYMIDFDFSSERKIEVPDAYSVLDELHEGVGRAFRWCITDELHDALQPSDINDHDSG
jgi:uncharacterized protein (TIGR04255 family)